MCRHKSTDVSIDSTPPCMRNGMAETCMDKVLPMLQGIPQGWNMRLPCLMGRVSSLAEYTDMMVKTANKADAMAIKDDCGNVESEFGAAVDTVVASVAPPILVSTSQAAELAELSAKRPGTAATTIGQGAISLKLLTSLHDSSSGR
ncbi:unnamed protein product [Amoebophrya sp. A25]|nr:unnamed protein product [Amoebophrya sp. A25]|eukprot:GSA25T00023576001.1